MFKFYYICVNIFFFPNLEHSTYESTLPATHLPATCLGLQCTYHLLIRELPPTLTHMLAALSPLLPTNLPLLLIVSHALTSVYQLLATL